MAKETTDPICTTAVTVEASKLVPYKSPQTLVGGTNEKWWVRRDSMQQKEKGQGKDKKIMRKTGKH